MPVSAKYAKSSSEVDPDDSLFLDDTFIAMSGNKWTNADGWENRKVDPASCFGITVREERVIQVDLRENNLANLPPKDSVHRILLTPEEAHVVQEFKPKGVLVNRPPPEIGGIPQSLGNLTALVYLDLRRNRLQGEIPTSIGQCTTLQHLNLYANELEGPIPAEIGQLHHLRVFSVGRNRFSGVIPPSLFGGCTMLQECNLASNLFEGFLPDTIGQAKGMKQLDARHNKLVGPITDEIGRLEQMERYGALYLSDNLIEDWAESSLDCSKVVVAHHRRILEVREWKSKKKGIEKLVSQVCILQ